MNTKTCADDEWLKLLHDIQRSDLIAGPRGLKTRELLGKQSVITMEDPILSIRSRKIGYRFMAAEAAWILSGDNRVETIAPYSSAIANFSDDGVRFFGAYGPPIRDQLGHVVRSLRHDRETRQSVVSVWRPNPPGTKDVPCTLSLQWLIRRNAIHCLASMRSSDVWLGWPYDVFNFSMVSLAILLELNFSSLKLGNLYLTAGSQHNYEEHWAEADRIILGPNEYYASTAKIHNMVKTPKGLIELLWSFANEGGLAHG